jgi:hypothetical protein
MPWKRRKVLVCLASQPERFWAPRNGLTGTEMRADFFSLIKAQRVSYFLNRFSKAWRASLWRGGAIGGEAELFWVYDVGAVSFSTVVRNS